MKSKSAASAIRVALSETSVPSHQMRLSGWLYLMFLIPNSERGTTIAQPPTTPMTGRAGFLTDTVHPCDEGRDDFDTSGRDPIPVVCFEYEPAIELVEMVIEVARITHPDRSAEIREGQDRILRVLPEVIREDLQNRYPRVLDQEFDASLGGERISPPPMFGYGLDHLAGATLVVLGPQLRVRPE